MSTSNDEVEEVKTLTKHNLASIVWPLRTPKGEASFDKEFANHLRVRFNEPSPKKYTREFNDFASLRSVALSSLGENSLRDANSLRHLKKYYCQLASMLARFKDSGAVFSWKDSFGRGSAEGNLEFELNNIMYDIAAIHNELGAKVPRTNETTTREACLNYNSALWWVTELRDNRTGLKPKEMGHDLLTFFHHVLKAQAQECVLSHSLKSGMRVDNVAKIAAQVFSDYEIAEKLAVAPLYADPFAEILNGASVFQNWRATVEFKRKYYSALAQFLMGLSSSDDNAKEIGIRISRLALANKNLDSAKSLIPNTLDSATTKLAYEAFGLLLKKKLEKAIKFNDNVYRSSIPNSDTLPQIEPKLVIAAAPFSPSSIPEYQDLFSSVVSIEAVQTTSIYSQKKDELSRQINADVSRQDEELVQMMSTLNIDKRNLRLPTIGASDDLIEICAELSMNPNIVDDVLTKLEELDDKSEEIQKLLEDVENMLKRRPNRQYEEELRKFKSTHEEALRTTQSLHKQLHRELQQKIQLMATTNNPAELVPKVNKTSDSDEEVIRKLEKLLDKVDEMKSQRASLINQLRQSLDQDDVIKHVVAASSEHELKKVFDTEIQKHNKYLDPLRSNLKLQNEMLDTLERVNAQYGQVKLNHRSQMVAMREHVESLKKYYNQFKATSDGINEGLSYHNKMVELVKKFHGKVRASDDLNDLLN